MSGWTRLEKLVMSISAMGFGLCLIIMAFGIPRKFIQTESVPLSNQCDAVVENPDYPSGRIMNFDEFQQILNSTQDGNNDQVIKICVEKNILIQNKAQSQVGALVIPKNNMWLYGDPAEDDGLMNGAIPRLLNFRLSPNPDENSALILKDKTGFKISNIRLSVMGTDSVGLWSIQSQIDFIEGVTFDAGIPLLAASGITGFYFHHSTVGVIKNVDIQVKSANGRGILAEKSTIDQLLTSKLFSGWINGVGFELKRASFIRSIHGTQISSSASYGNGKNHALKLKSSSIHSITNSQIYSLSGVGQKSFGLTMERSSIQVLRRTVFKSASSPARQLKDSWIGSESNVRDIDHSMRHSAL